MFSHHRHLRRPLTIAVALLTAAATMTLTPGGAAGAAPDSPDVRTFDDEPQGSAPADCTVQGAITVAAADFGDAEPDNRAMRIVDDTANLQSQANCAYPDTAEVFLGFDWSTASFDNAFIFGLNGINSAGTSVNKWRLSLTPKGPDNSDAVLQAYDGSRWNQLGYLAGVGAADHWSQIRLRADADDLEIWVDGTRFATTASWHPAESLGDALFASSGSAPVGMDFYVDNLLRSDQRPDDWPTDEGLNILPVNAPEAHPGEPLTDITVAEFTGPSAGAADYSATVDWGDGAGPESATVSGPDAEGRFGVVGSHTYDALGSYVLTVAVTDADGTTVARSVLTQVTRQMITIATEDAEHNVHFPDVVRLASGRILAAYYAGNGHIDDDGSIKVVHSDDNGTTWSQPEMAVDLEYDERDPKLAQLSDGTVLLSYFQTEWLADGSRIQHGEFVVRSSDDGASWSEPVHIDGIGIASHGPIVELDNGDLLAPLYGAAPGASRESATVARSVDGGLTWRAQDEVVIAAGDEFSFQEPNLSVLDDGEIVAVIRTTTNPMVAYLSRSVDNGHTWTPAEPTDIPASSHHQLLTSDGSILLTYGDVTPGVSGRPTSGLLVSDPHGSWNDQYRIPIYDSGNGDQANPSSVELEDGRFLTLGYNVVDRTLIGVFTSWADYRDPALDLSVLPAPELTISTAQVGAEITVGTASGVFGSVPESAQATVDWGDGQGEQPATLTADDGDYRITAPSPYRSAGTRTATVQVSDRTQTAEASMEVTVTDTARCDGNPDGPTCSVSPSLVQPGDRVTVQLSGFPARSTVIAVLSTDQPTSRSITTSRDGEATVRLVVPPRATAGSYRLWVHSGTTAISAPFTVAGD